MKWIKHTRLSMPSVDKAIHGEKVPVSVASW